MSRTRKSSTRNACPSRALRGLELDGDPVVHAPEHPRAQHEREDGGDDQIDDVPQMRKAPPEEDVAHRLDRRLIGFPQCRKLTSVGWSWIGPRSSPPASNEYMIGVRKNHGSNRAATMCSTSRKITFAAATASERPATSATTGAISGIVSQMVSRVSGMTIMFTGISTTRIASERDQLRGDGGQRGELARETHLLDQVRVVEQRARGRWERRRQEHPDSEPREEIQRVMVDLGDGKQHREHERVDPHEDERVDQRPQDAEKCAFVLGAKVAAKQVRKELAMVEKLGVHPHPNRL